MFVFLCEQNILLFVDGDSQLYSCNSQYSFRDASKFCIRIVMTNIAVRIYSSG
jgi:hypothetical protein